MPSPSSRIEASPSSVSVVLLVLRARGRCRVAAKRSPMLRLGWGAAAGISLLATLLVFALIPFYLDLVRNLPSLEILPVLLNRNDGQLWQPTQLFDRTGQQVILTLQNPAAAGWHYLTLNELPPAVVTTTLATADPQFWSHRGFSLTSLGTGEHPTLAQKLVSDLLLWDEPPSLRRDLRERLLAAQVTARFGREQILEWYLNAAQYGHWLYGIDAAAHAYLGKSAAELTLAEAAFLAAAAQSPELDPLAAPQLTFERQQLILQLLERQGNISAAQAVQARQEVFHLRSPSAAISLAPLFTDLVFEQLASRFPIGRIERGGLRIITTIDLDLQQQISCVVAAQLVRLQNASDGATSCDAARLLPTLTLPAGEFQGLAGAAVVLDPRTGQVIALAGDVPPASTAARLPARPAGSLYTPLIYLSAFARGLGPASLIWDLPNAQAVVSNLDGQAHGPLRLRTALANDYLAPAAALFDQVGEENVWRTAQWFGIAPRHAASGVTALFENETSLLEAAHAMGVFANQGILAGRTLDDPTTLQPTVVVRLEDPDGRLWLDWSEPQRRAIVSASLAYFMVHVLSDEAARWPSMGHPNPLEVGRPVAVKVGQTLTGNDLWTVGATPQWVVGVWVGRTEAASAAEAPRLPLPVATTLWHAILQYTTRDQPVQGWKMPADVVQKTVCDPSGLLPTVECPRLVEEIFQPGSEPTRLDPLYRSVLINRQSGKLATLFTPPELVEARVYLMVPAQASEWARQANLPIPPNEYDVIPAIRPSSPNAQISTPALFAHVSGQVTFYGSAGGERFSYYRLQVGAGLDPQRWIQIGEDVATPVKDGVLGVWDTTNLSGLYAVQLQVVTTDQRIETAVTQVTVDNQPPQVALLNPVEGQRLSPHPQGVILLQAQADDDIALARLEYWIDGKLVGTFSEAPFTLAWRASGGKHRLSVRVADLAGNSAQAGVNFEVSP